MEQRGDWPADTPWIREAADAFPRDAFAPSQLWHWYRGGYVAVDRDDDPDRWAALVYGSPDEAAVTQVTDGHATSSLSCAGVVASMLHALAPERGETVLELGTGTGWNAALLERRTGPGQVVSVEWDPLLADRARARLRAAGAEVEVVHGDGGRGWPDNAPYDRVIATYAVEEVPWAWVAQTRPGGRIVTPWDRLGHVALRVAQDGSCARGPVVGLAQFMPARGTGGTRDYRQVRGEGEPDSSQLVKRDLAPLRDSVPVRFAMRVALPDVHVTTARDEDGVNAWLHDGASSWAALSAVGDGTVRAYQGGPRRLADELDQAWDQWLALDCPQPYDYGLMVTAGHQYAWCHDPGTGPRWPVRTPQAPTA